MPLPTARDLAWPPKQLAEITPVLETWSAWYEGTPDALVRAYGGNTSAFTEPSTRPAQRRGGVVGALARFWWGRPIDDASQRRDQLHVPVAADLARVSADLLYAEPPTLTLAADAAQERQDAQAGGETQTREPSVTQQRLDEYVDDGFHTVLATGAEIGAILGGRYQRVTWDPAVIGKPFLTTVDADAALPEFRWGCLVAVTFWHVVDRQGGTVWRHLERHELDDDGRGLIFHGLYEGTGATLGVQRELTAHPATEPLAAQVDDQGALVTGRTPGLCVEYIPNQLPQRRWRKDPIGRNLGRSDLDGVEQLMDALDEAYSSLWRDIRLAKGRIVVASQLLESSGPGQGAEFNLDREVYEAVKGMAPENGALPITPNQFEIRVDEHLRACDDATARIISTAGYSAQTLSDGVEGGQMTATEVHARERRSYSTRDRKIRAERPAIARLAEKMLTIDAEVFGTRGLEPGVVHVEFGETVQDGLITLASTAQLLSAARAASTQTKVEMVHPDWSPDQVKAEVGRILAEDAGEVLASPDDVPPAAQADPTKVKAQFDALGVGVRAGVDPDDAADRVGLDGVRFTGAVPTSLRLPESDAASLEQA
ncbi:hypothetical protein M768_13875 [Cellulosimicrobium cellulans F16]|uniref:Phage portal protein n=1 Tax=Cellulosimicrobium cellulans F16 TaxID=1350482 RepID=A0A0M0F5X2_CELCE|nr:hypothetical protein [Cellulosimicrobium cellulans]KON72591.1 hypothetical protein M768_13875 [Cellulosimicrobium cellulans F16]